jgi:type I restriction enzyme S subunit
MSNNRQELLNNGAAVGPQGEGRDGPSTFPRYPVYKDSGVEWLGEVPEHWVMGSLKNMAQIRNGRDYKEVESADGEYPVIGSGGQFSNATQYLYEGESVLLGRKGTIDKPLYINGRFWTVDTMFYTEISKEACAKFFYYNSLTIPFGYYSTSTALPSMTQADLLNHPAAIPTKLEQTQIARFLDHETARIDALIAEQQRLIELLKEKRQAVISHAVTKGLDPTVPMKDSGVEWLGEVPAHWVVSKLKFMTDRVVDCPHETPNYNPDGDYLVIRTADLDQGLLKTEQMYRLDRDEYVHRTRRASLKKNDVVYGREGERWGYAALVPESDLYALGQRMMQIRVEPHICPEYFMFQLNSVAVYRQGEVDTVGATSPHVNISTIINYQMMVPPKEEQSRISMYLNKILLELDSLIRESADAMGLLQERRSALISAAVTGKIDVRNW